jgi:hypothetical protein
MAQYITISSTQSGTKYNIPTKYLTEIRAAIDDHFGYLVDVEPSVYEGMTVIVWKYESREWGDLVEYFIKGFIASANVFTKETT